MPSRKLSWGAVVDGLPKGGKSPHPQRRAPQGASPRGDRAGTEKNPTGGNAMKPKGRDHPCWLKIPARRRVQG